LAKARLTEEDKLILRAVASELREIRVALDELNEAFAMMSDKNFMKAFNADETYPTEKQVDRYQLALQKQADQAEKELRR